jgi:hypothetical protein
VQRVAHAAYDTADDDRAASDPVEVAIQNDASSVRSDSRPREIVGTISASTEDDDSPENDESPAHAGLSGERAREDSNL